MTIDLRKDAPNQVSNVNPDELSKEINTLQEIQQEITNQENKLKDLKDREKYYANIIIPDLMSQLNLKTLTLKDGSQIAVKNIFGASMVAEKKPEAFDWLRKNGLGDLIKNMVTVSFGRNEDNKAADFAVLAQGQGYQPSRKLKVEPMTLKALVRERLESGKEMPTDLFNVFAGSRTKITRK